MPISLTSRRTAPTPYGKRAAMVLIKIALVGVAVIAAARRGEAADSGSSALGITGRCTLVATPIGEDGAVVDVPAGHPDRISESAGGLV